ncbi:MAG TPA: WecB/TagA/CpsF family glycosyltransferase [Patescibacteria group bacterium]|nr:WecB/TagA/CpsF family glycosyltransferase [Patescibacteria group bacterium]
MKNNIELSPKFGQILGINVISTTTQEVLTAIKQKVSDNVQFSIVTPNPEIVLMAQKNKELKSALNSATFPIPDGIGLAQAVKYESLGAPKNIILRAPVVFIQGLVVGVATFVNKKWLTDSLNIIPGRVVFMELIKLANDNKWRIFFFGGESDEAELSRKNLESRYKNIKIQTNKGPIVNKSGEPVTEVDRKVQIDVISQINKFKPQLLFVAFNNPKQEIWIHKQSLPLRGKNFPQLNIGGAMAVGGTFRYIAGLSKLPPKWMEELGLEWVWRLITEPYRIKRIFNAWPIFPLKVFWYKLTNI